MKIVVMFLRIWLTFYMFIKTISQLILQLIETIMFLIKTLKSAICKINNILSHLAAPFTPRNSAN